MKKLRVHLCGAVVALMSALPAVAAPSCTASGALAPFDYPGARAFPTSNNLLLPAGKAIPADGQPLTLRGRVIDRECKPVTEAVVELWQTGPFGRWAVASREDRASSQPVFAGAGRTYTDSDGYFTFITAFPAPQRYAAPNLNIRIVAQGMAEYKSALFFAGDARNEQDKAFRKLPAATRDTISVQVSADDNDALTGALSIVLPGKAPYRTY